MNACLTRKSTSLGMLALLAATSASAVPLRINTGADFNLEPNGSTLTASFDSLGYTDTQRTNIYLGNPGTPGTTVVTTNIPSIMNFYGFSAGTKTTLNGTTVDFSFPSIPGQNNIDGLNNPASSDLNGFSSGTGFPLYGAGAVGGVGGAWGLTYAYQFVGTLVDDNSDKTVDRIAYGSGVLSLFYNSAFTDPNNNKEVLRFIVDGTSSTGVKGLLDFSFAGGDTFVQQFFQSAGTGNTLYSQWLADPSSLRVSMDVPVDPADSSSTLWNSGSALISQSSFSGALRINDPISVPEPGTLWLGALALAGLAVGSRRPARVRS